MLSRVLSAGLLLLALCGPAPSQGFRELQDLLARRGGEWRTFYQAFRVAWEKAREAGQEAVRTAKLPAEAVQELAESARESRR